MTKQKRKRPPLKAGSAQKNRIEIIRKGGRTHLTIDGKDMSERCLGFSLTQDGTGVMRLEVVCACNDLVVEADDAEIELSCEPRGK